MSAFKMRERNMKAFDIKFSALALSISSLLLPPQISHALPSGTSPIVGGVVPNVRPTKLPLRWVNVSNNRIPANTVFGGQESSTQPLYVCRGEHEKGVHIGKTRPEFGGCYIGWGGKSVLLTSYQVLVDQGPATWVGGRGGSVPSTAFAGGQENNENLYICMANYQGGSHSGKIRQAFRGCGIAWGSQEIIVPVYDVLTIPPTRGVDPTGGQTAVVGLAVSGNFSFGNITVGQSKTSTLTIQNSGNSPLNVSSIDYPVGFSGAWSGSVAAGATQLVNVTFQPTQAQNYSGNLTVNSNKTSGNNTLAVSGVGVAASGGSPSPTSKTLTAGRAIAGWDSKIAAGQKRPVVVFTPGWGGSGAVNASQSTLNKKMVNEGYVTLAIGFDSSAQWNSNLPEKVVEGLGKLCADSSIPANCAAILLNGTSYGGAQNDKVVRYARSQGYNVASKKIIGFVSQDAGYVPPGNVTDFNNGTFNRTGLAEVSQYAVAMIENLGDTTFPVDTCEWGNCGARVLARQHKAANHSNVYSLCPNNGDHSARDAAGNWDAWVISATKKIIHSNAGVPTFSGYSAPSVNVSNACQ